MKMAITAITIKTAQVIAIANLTLLHGRSPATSPVSPLMHTWNGRLLYSTVSSHIGSNMCLNPR